MVKIKKLELENFRGFEKLSIDFNDRMTCFVGVNGAGKSTILSAISKNLSLFANKGNFTSKEEFRLKKSDVHLYNSQIKVNEEAWIRLVFDVDEEEIESQNCITAKGDKFPTSVFTDKVDLLDKQEFPLFCHYGATRTSKDVEKALNKESPVSDPYYLYRNLTDFENDYEEFFSWFRKREDIENERLIASQKNGIIDYQYDDELQAVREAIASFFGQAFELRVSRIENMMLVKNGENEIPFTSLSDGEKSLILLFGDIARKLAVTSTFDFKNLPHKSKEILNRNGIILIDEIDLHLHPSWQRKVCNALKNTFPNCQFVITTHSPQVLGELKTDEIWLLNDFNVYRPDSSYGLTSNEVLDEIMDVVEEDNSLSRDGGITKKIQELNLFIELGKIKEAKSLIADIEKETGNELHDVNACKIAIEMMENE